MKKRMRFGLRCAVLAAVVWAATVFASSGDWRGPFKDAENGFTITITPDGEGEATYITSDGDKGRIFFLLGGEALFFSNKPPYDEGRLRAGSRDIEGRVTSFDWWDVRQGVIPKPGGQGHAERVGN